MECVLPVCPHVSDADKWSPALQIRTVLLSIQALLSAPNPDDPLANDVAELWKANEAKAIDNGRHRGLLRIVEAVCVPCTKLL